MTFFEMHLNFCLWLNELEMKWLRAQPAYQVTKIQLNHALANIDLRDEKIFELEHEIKKLKQRLKEK